MQVVKCQNIRTKPNFVDGKYEGHRDKKCRNTLLFLESDGIIVHCKSCNCWEKITLKNGKAEISVVAKDDLDFSKEMRAEVKSYAIKTSVNYNMEAEHGKQK
jgi:hypothetical protein